MAYLEGSDNTIWLGNLCSPGDSDFTLNYAGHQARQSHH